jgi:hypothetical protein
MQCTVATYTKEHVNDVWKVIKSGRRKFGPNWHGNEGYKRVDTFSKYFANLYREWNKSNKMCPKMKCMVTPRIIWQGDEIRCMESVHTLQCIICMTECKEILSHFKIDCTKVMNNNSNIYSSWNVVVNCASVSDLLLLHWWFACRRKTPNLHAWRERKNLWGAFQELLDKAALDQKAAHIIALE